MSEFVLGLQLMLYGLIGVFGTLILFYISIRIMTKLFSKKKTAEENK